MATFLDNRPFESSSLPAGAPVAEAVAAARISLAGSGRLIVSLRFDQVEPRADRIGEFLSRPLSDFGRVDFLSAEAKPVVLDALRQAQRTFEETLRVSADAAEALAAGHAVQAMQDLLDCIGAWAQVHESLIQGGSLLAVDFNTLIVEGRPLIDWLTGLAGRLRALRDAIEARDHVLLGDILRYELHDTLTQWQRMLTGFIAHVEQIEEVIP